MQDSSPRPASAQPPSTGAAAKVAAKTPDVRDAEGRAAAPDALEREPRSGPGPVVAAPTGTLSVRAWLRLARPRYLLLTVAPVLVAATWLWSRDAHIAIGSLILTGLSVALAQAGAHLLAASIETRRDGAVTGQTAQQSAAGMLPRVVVVVLAVSVLLGLPLVAAGGTPVLLVGGAALLVAVSSCAIPFAYRRLPLGEVVVALTCGPGVVAFTILAQRQSVAPFAVALGAGLGLFAAALVAAANLRALAAGGGTERASLVRLLGLRGGRLLYLAIVGAAYLAVLVAAVWHGAPHGALAVLFALPVAVLPVTGALRGRAAATLGPVVTGTLRAYAYFAFWLIIGLLLGAMYLHLLRIAGS